MKTRFNRENGTYEIVGITPDQLAVLSSIVCDVNAEADDFNNIEEENFIGITMSEEEIEILSSINIEFPN